AVQLRPQAFTQDGADVDRCSLQKYILASLKCICFLLGVPVLRRKWSAPPLDPEDGVAILRLHSITELHLNFLRTATEVEDLFRLLRQRFEFSREPGQGLVKSDELIAIFFQEFAAGFEGKAPV